MDAEARIEALETLLAERDEEIVQLRAQLGMDFHTPMEWGLTGAEQRLFGVLMARATATKEQLMAGVYAGRMDQAEIKIIDVFVCKARKKLAVVGITISTIWGQGYMLPPESKALAKALIVEAGLAVAA